MFLKMFFYIWFFSWKNIIITDPFQDKEEVVQTQFH